MFSVCLVFCGYAKFASVARGSIVESEFHQEFFQFRNGERLGNDELLILINRLGQGAVFFGLAALRIPFDDRLAVDLGALHIVVARHEMNHVRAEQFGELFDHFLFVVHLAAVADDAGEPDLAIRGKLQDALADVVRGIHRHHFAGADDVNFLGLAVADRHRKTAAHDVAQHVVKNVIEIFTRVVGTELFKHVDRGDDAAARAADAGFGTAGLHAQRVAETAVADVRQLHVLAFLAERVEHALLRQAAEQQARGVGLGIAADDHDFLAHLGQAGDGVLRGGGFPDSAFAVDCDFSHK